LAYGTNKKFGGATNHGVRDCKGAADVSGKRAAGLLL